MTPEEIEQLVNEKVTIAIAVYEAIRNIKAGSEAVGGQETVAKNTKRKQDGNRGKNVVNKRQKIVETSNAGKNVGKRYAGKQPYCNKCYLHHSGSCTVVCSKCQKVGHMAKNCKVAVPVPITVVPGGCYKCGIVGHIKRNCPKLKRQTLRAYEVITEEAHQDVN